VGEAMKKEKFDRLKKSLEQAIAHERGDQIMAELRRSLPSLAEKYGVRSIGVFGSYVRREENSDSDLDLLVDFYETPGLLKFIELENYLTYMLGIKVDLVMEEALKPNIGKQVLSEVVKV
jgi:predicted nucleotidyltransferase